MFVPNLQDAAGFSTYYLVYAYFLFFWIAQATSWNILSGYTGYFSFGQGAFYGLGVYTAGDLVSARGDELLPDDPDRRRARRRSSRRAVGRARVPPRLAARRDLRAADARRDVHARLGRRAQRAGSTAVRGSRSRSPTTRTCLGDFQDLVYRLGLAVAALAVVTAFLIQHSRFGWGLFSIRDEEGVAEELGVPTFRYKMFAITDLRRARRACRARSRRCRSAT